MRKRAKKNRKQKQDALTRQILLLTALTNLVTALVNLINRLSQK